MAEENAAKSQIIHQVQKKGKVFKIIVVGDSNVGKTSLTFRFCEGKLLDSPEATIGVDFRTKTLQIDDEHITLQLWDTAGQERFRKTMVRHYYRNANAVVFVYDVSNLNSFVSLRKWIDEVDSHCPVDIPRILIGNKCDKQPEISTNAAQTFADKFNMPLFETSAQLDTQCDNIESIFVTLAHKLKNQKSFLPPKVERLSTNKDQNTSSSTCC